MRGPHRAAELAGDRERVLGVAVDRIVAPGGGGEHEQHAIEEIEHGRPHHRAERDAPASREQGRVDLACALDRAGVRDRGTEHRAEIMIVRGLGDLREREPARVAIAVAHRDQRGEHGATGRVLRRKLARGRGQRLGADQLAENAMDGHEPPRIRRVLAHFLGAGRRGVGVGEAAVEERGHRREHLDLAQPALQAERARLAGKGGGRDVEAGAIDPLHRDEALAQARVHRDRAIDAACELERVGEDHVELRRLEVIDERGGRDVGDVEPVARRQLAREIDRLERLGHRHARIASRLLGCGEASQQLRAERGGFGALGERFGERVDEPRIGATERELEPARQRDAREQGVVADLACEPGGAIAERRGARVLRRVLERLGLRDQEVAEPTPIVRRGERERGGRALEQRGRVLECELRPRLLRRALGGHDRGLGREVTRGE